MIYYVDKFIMHIVMLKWTRWSSDWDKQIYIFYQKKSKLILVSYV